MSDLIQGRRYAPVTDTTQFSYPWRNMPEVPSAYPWWWDLAMFPDLQAGIASMTGFKNSPYARAKILENDPRYRSGFYYRDAPYIMNANTPYEYDIRTKEGQYLAEHPQYQDPNWQMNEEIEARRQQVKNDPGNAYLDLATTLLYAMGAANAGAQGVQARRATRANIGQMKTGDWTKDLVPGVSGVPRSVDRFPSSTLEEARALLADAVKPNAPAGAKPTDAQLLNPANVQRPRFGYEQTFAAPGVPARVNGLPVLNLHAEAPSGQLNLFNPPEVGSNGQFVPMTGSPYKLPEYSPEFLDMLRANVVALQPQNAVAPEALNPWLEGRFNPNARTIPVTNVPGVPRPQQPVKEPEAPIKGQVVFNGVKYNTVEEAKAAELARMRNNGTKEERENANNPRYTLGLEEKIKQLADTQYQAAIVETAPQKNFVGRAADWWKNLTNTPRNIGQSISNLLFNPQQGGAPLNRSRSIYDERYNNELQYRTGVTGRSSNSVFMPGPYSNYAYAAPRSTFDTFVNPFNPAGGARTPEDEAARVARMQQAIADANSATSAQSAGAQIAGGGYGGISIGDINAAFAAATRGLQEMQQKNQVERDAAKIDLDKYGGELDTLVNQKLPEVVKQQEISPDANLMSALAANIAAVLNPSINALGQRSQYVGELNAKYGREHDELLRKHEDMKSERLFKYQALADKFRRAADIYDKRGDTDRSLELAAKHDDVLKRIDAIMQQQNQEANRAVQRQEIQARTAAAGVTNKDKQYLQMVNNLEQLASGYQKQADNATNAKMKRHFSMLARQKTLALQDINEQGLRYGGDTSKIVSNPYYAHEQALSAFMRANPTVSDSASFDREFRRARGFSNENDFATTWGIPRNEFRNWWLDRNRRGLH